MGYAEISEHPLLKTNALLYDHLIDCLRGVEDDPFTPEPTSASLLLHKLKYENGVQLTV